MQESDLLVRRIKDGTVIDHIDHVVNVAGIDHVGLGSDFDNTPFLPENLKDVSDYPNITFELLRRGYSETDILKILGRNVLRVLAEVEQIAESRPQFGLESATRLHEVGIASNRVSAMTR